MLVLCYCSKEVDRGTIAAIKDTMLWHQTDLAYTTPRHPAYILSTHAPIEEHSFHPRV
jgi:hypothetical protein